MNKLILNLLESANGNRIRLTKIMYEVYLSHGLTKEYVRLLIEKGLMEYLDGEKMPSGSMGSETVEGEMLEELRKIRRGVNALVWVFVIIPIVVSVITIAFAHR